jgi:7-cyano-7-deazaguanine synthase
MKKAIIILSGGLDSSTCLYEAKRKGYEVYAISFDYGQKHTKEIECAKAIAQEAGVLEHRIVTLHKPTKNALTDAITIPTDRTLQNIAEEVPVTYVQARNTIFISHALQYCEEIDADYIYIGVTAMDYSGYPDCRPEYITKWQELIDLATKKTAQDGKTISIEAPLQFLYKAEIVQKGTQLGVPYEKTWSCYKGGEKSCGECDSCKLRLKGFQDANLVDPIEYEN